MLRGRHISFSGKQYWEMYLTASPFKECVIVWAGDEVSAYSAEMDAPWHTAISDSEFIDAETGRDIHRDILHEYQNY
jgi:hypothetical protein